MVQIKHNKSRIPTGGRLTSWLFTQRGGVEFGATEDKSIHGQGGGLEPGTSGLQVQHPTTRPRSPSCWFLKWNVHLTPRISHWAGYAPASKLKKNLLRVNHYLRIKPVKTQNENTWLVLSAGKIRRPVPGAGKAEVVAWKDNISDWPLLVVRFSFNHLWNITKNKLIVNS